MRLEKVKIEEVLERALRGPTHRQMEAARDRVSARLRFERQRGAATQIQRSEPRESTWWRPAVAVAAAALIALVVSVGLPLRDQRPYAVLEAAESSMYRISNGNRVPIRVGDRIASQETLRSNGGSGAVLALEDGSRIEIGSKSELWWDRADEGVMVRLNTGSIIVSAAKEAARPLYVQTNDMTASVARTTLLVNVVDDGSSVAVIEGEAQVREGNVNQVLGPGQHLSTSPTLALRPLSESLAWSRNADRHLAILAAFAKSMATTSGGLTSLNETAGGQLDSGQRAASAGPVFEEASVRLCDPSALPATPQGARGGGSGSLQMTPGRLNALCMTVATLIRTAYGIGTSFSVDAPSLELNQITSLGNAGAQQVRGGPDWVRSDRYTIEAVANGSASAPTMSGSMLRDLLQRRFQLAAHVESEPLSAFALTVAPGGLKMTAVDADGCTPPPTQGPPALPPPDLLNRIRRGETPMCGLSIGGAGPNTTVIGGAAFWPQLIPMLGEIVGSRVIDRTNISSADRFTYALEFAPDERTLGPMGGRGRGRMGSQGSDQPRAPDLFTALKDQLGLRLDAVQTPREYVVIDRIERPSPN